MTFGKRLRFYRQQKKKPMTQKDLERESGIPQTTISDWENDKSEPTASDIVKLAAALGVTVNELLGDPDDLKKTG